MNKTILTEKDYNLFYKSVVFGKIDDSVKISVKDAYKDLCRTITGFSKNDNHDKIFNNALALLTEEIRKMINFNLNSQENFDKWHKECCDKLIETFKNQKFYYGQAQKWINMSLKNLSMIEHELVEKNYEYFHVPIDNYIINITGIKISVAWSRITNYNEYLNFQKNFRVMYEGIPLDNEFYLWLKATRNIQVVE
jgi:hypothetical protein